MIVSHSTLRIGPYLFYINLSLNSERGPAVKIKPPFSNACMLMMYEIMRSGDAQYNTGNGLKVTIFTDMCPV